MILPPALLALFCVCAVPMASTGNFIAVFMINSFCVRLLGLHMRRRVAVFEDNAARLIHVTDIVTYDDELSPLQVRGIIHICECRDAPFLADRVCFSLLNIDSLPKMNGLGFFPSFLCTLIVHFRRVSHVCEDTLGFLKQTKHKAWRDGMFSIFGNCAKAFIPSLKHGLITRMY